MSLADVLRELAPALQSGGGRIRIDRRRDYSIGLVETLHVVYGGSLHRCCTLSPERYADMGPFALVHLEAALREEVEGRGWMWRTFAYPLEQGYGAEVEKEILSKCFSETADSPAAALAMALLAALGPEQER